MISIFRKERDSMSEYKKPIVIEIDELAEGVYTASGSGTSECWEIIDVKTTQDDNGIGEHIFELQMIHKTGVKHISSDTYVTLTFNYAVTNAHSEFPCTVSGNKVTITRTLLADAYHSGDTVTYKIWVSAGDLASTKGLACIDWNVRCAHQTNVQGEID